MKILLGIIIAPFAIMLGVILLMVLLFLAWLWLTIVMNIALFGVQIIDVIFKTKLFDKFEPIVDKISSILIEPSGIKKRF
jgi:hypothetical protein